MGKKSKKNEAKLDSAVVGAYIMHALRDDEVKEHLFESMNADIADYIMSNMDDPVEDPQRRIQQVLDNCDVDLILKDPAFKKELKKFLKEAVESAISTLGTV